MFDYASVVAYDGWKGRGSNFVCSSSKRIGDELSDKTLAQCRLACEDKFEDGCFFISYGKGNKEKKCSLFETCEYSEGQTSDNYDSYASHGYVSVGERSTNDNK